MSRVKCSACNRTVSRFVSARRKQNLMSSALVRFLLALNSLRVFLATNLRRLGVGIFSAPRKSSRYSDSARERVAGVAMMFQGWVTVLVLPVLALRTPCAISLLVLHDDLCVSVLFDFPRTTRSFFITFLSLELYSTYTVLIPAAAGTRHQIFGLSFCRRSRIRISFPRCVRCVQYSIISVQYKCWSSTIQRWWQEQQRDHERDGGPDQDQRPTASTARTRRFALEQRLPS